MISVIVPIYNVADYLPRCLDSILKQTYDNLEIILVDDGSTDNCGSICDSYAKEDNRIKVIHKANGGLSSARNAGLDIAKGDYISFIDSDDFIDESMYETMLKALKSNDADVCLCSYDRVNDNNEFFGITSYNDAVLSRDDAYEMLVQGNVYFVIACNKLYKKEIFNGLRFMEGKIHEDEQLIHHIYGKCEKIVTLSDVLYHYYERGTSIIGTNKYSIKALDELDAYMDRAEYFNRKSLYGFASRMLLNSTNLYFSLKRELRNNNVKAKPVLIKQKKQLRELIRRTPLEGINLYDKLTLKLFIANTGLYYLWIRLLNLLRR